MSLNETCRRAGAVSAERRLRKGSLAQSFQWLGCRVALLPSLSFTWLKGWEAIKTIHPGTCPKLQRSLRYMLLFDAIFGQNGCAWKQNYSFPFIAITAIMWWL